MSIEELKEYKEKLQKEAEKIKQREKLIDDIEELHKKGKGKGVLDSIAENLLKM